MNIFILILSCALCFNSFSATSSMVFSTIERQLYLAGETHIYDDLRSEFARDLEKFKNNNGKVLALEMIETSDQALLDAYMECKIGSEEKLWEYLERRWSYNTENYMELIAKARLLGLELLAVDLPRNQRPNEITILPVIPEISLVRIAREAHMAATLCKENKKTVLLVGSIHTKENFLPRALMKKCYKLSHSFIL